MQFGWDVVDYLIKPVSPERFEKAIKKATDLLNLQRLAEASTQKPPAQEDHFFVFSNYQQVKINISDILYIEGMGDYVKIHLEKQKRPVLTLERLKNLAVQLETRGFYRIHRSFLINAEKIEAKQKAQVCIAGSWLPVGESFTSLVLK